MFDDLPLVLMEFVLSLEVHVQLCIELSLAWQWIRNKEGCIWIIFEQSSKFLEHEMFADLLFYYQTQTDELL